MWWVSIVRTTLAPFEVALFHSMTVLVLNEMVLVLVIGDVMSTSTSTSRAFFDWKFQDELDDKLFDESEFTIEKITATIDFVELSRRFEKQ